MKVIHVCTSDSAGGAARAAMRLHRGLLDLVNPAIDSRMLVADRSTTDPTVSQYRPRGGVMRRINRRTRRWRLDRQLRGATRSQPAGSETFSIAESAHGADLHFAVEPCDVINLHWVSGLLDFPSFFPAVSRRSKIVWTLHDMNAMTGGCHFDGGCQRWMRGCGACPQLGSRDEKDLSAETWQTKLNTFAKLEADQLHLVAPSRWMADCIAKSPLLGRFEVSHIPNSLETDAFVPIEQSLCRAALGIPQAAKVLLFVAQSLDIRRKGFALLQDTVARMTGDSLFLLSVGSGKPPGIAGVGQLHLGNVQSERILSLAYGAADVFVIPSVQDNLPNTVLESMSCGTPVAGFAVGGMPDLVRNGETGFLTPAHDTVQLAAAIQHLLENNSLRDPMRIHCRRHVIENHALSIQSKRYAELYQRLLS